MNSLMTDTARTPGTSPGAPGWQAGPPPPPPEEAHGAGAGLVDATIPVAGEPTIAEPLPGSPPPGQAEAAPLGSAAPGGPGGPSPAGMTGPGTAPSAPLAPAATSAPTFVAGGPAGATGAPPAPEPTFSGSVSPGATPLAAGRRKRHWAGGPPWFEQRAVGTRQALERAPLGSLWLAGAAAVILAYGVAWLTGIVESTRHQFGFTAQDRALTVLAPGSVDWAFALLLAAAIVSAGRRLDQLEGDPRRPRMVILALAVAATTALVAAILAIIVELTNFGHGINYTFSGLLARIEAVPVAAAAAWWAWRHLLEHEKASR